MKTLRRSLIAAVTLAAVTVAPAAYGEQETVSAKGAHVSALNEAGNPTAAIDGGTVLTLKASDFQAIKGGAGGVYVVFGWVSDPDGLSWTPTKGGVTGEQYRYAPDEETADNQGYSRYVAFEGSKTASAANGGLVAADGSWETTLTVPAAKFESFDREGDPYPVDCLKDTCGVITIGAHNVKNPNNETFTPITFVEDPAAPQEPSETNDETPAPSESAPSGETAAKDEPAKSEPSPSATASGDATESSQSDDTGGTNPLPMILGAGVAVGAALLIMNKRKK